MELNSRFSTNVFTLESHMKAFKTSFFLWTINEWNKIGLSIHNSSYSVFRKHLLDEIKLKADPIYSVHNPMGIKLLTQVRRGLSNLNIGSITIWNWNNLLCTCSLEVESIALPSF